MPEHAFLFTGSSASFGVPSAAVAGSDVNNWYPFGQLSTPDFYVRNGIGSPVGFHPIWPTLSSPNWLQYTPTNTWNGISHAAAGIYGQANTHENMYTNLNNSLTANTTYQFSGWFYCTQTVNPNWVLGSGNTGFIEITMSDPLGNNIIAAGTLQIPHWDKVANNNGWYYASIIFTTPASLAPNTSVLYVENTSYDVTYVFVDDLSLVEAPSTTFPQLINCGNEDPTHRRIHVDANDNVYVAGSINAQAGLNATALFGNPIVSTAATTAPHGFFIVKYNSTGTILWTKMYPYLQMGDFDFDANGDILYTGWYKPGINPLSSFNPGILLTTQSVNWHWGSDNLVIGKLSATTGNQVYLQGYGGPGLERGLDIEVDAATNTLYVAAEIGFNSVNSSMGTINWNGTPLVSDKILSATYSSTGASPATYSSSILGSGLTCLALKGSNLYVLTQQRVSRLNPINLSTTNFISVNPQGKALHIDANSNIYVSYPISNLVVRYNSLLASPVTASLGTSFYPFAITSSNGNVYFSGLEDTPTGDNFWVGKYDFAGTAMVWNKYSSGSNTSVKLYGLLEPSWMQIDVACLSNGKQVFVGGFDTQGTPWAINFDAKSVAGVQNTPHSDQYLFVSTIEDLGTSGQFKMMSTGSEFADDLIVYPQPASGLVKIESSAPIFEISSLTLSGQLLLTSKGQNSNELEVALQKITPGMYILYVKTSNGVQRKKISIY